MLEVIRWLLAILLALLGLGVIVRNYVLVYFMLFRTTSKSVVPLIGGGLLSVACLLCPALPDPEWAWIPLVVDPGCLGLFVVAVIAVILMIRTGGGP
jgi:hypothetical protein